MRWILLLFVAGYLHAADLVRIPGTTYSVADLQTGVPIQVCISPFLISPSEITQREYVAIAGRNPSHSKGDNLPVENVSWWDAIRYCNLRSIREGLQPCYDLSTGRCDRRKNGYRLPTEAEWGWAAADHLQNDPSRPANLGGTGTTNEADLRGGGTMRVESFPSNRYGLYDMTGNVWEWCTDYFNMALSPMRQLDPAGPPHGVARVIRGGSFRSTRSKWAGAEYRSSMEPDRRSRYTGFRVVRSESAAPVASASPDWYKPFDQRPPGFETSIGSLIPLVDTRASQAAWATRAHAIRSKWSKILGSPTLKPFVPAARTIEVARQNGYLTRVMQIQLEPDYWGRIAITYPDRPLDEPLPVVIVPFYDVDGPVAMNLGGRRIDPLSAVSFAHFAAQRGFIAVSTRWFGMDYAEGYAEAISDLNEKHPGCTGLGKWVWDAQRLLDYLETLPEVDRARIGIMGWSLGAKMALYAAAFDDRISAVVSIEGGIGLGFSNYGDYWYLGSALDRMPPGTDQHELLGLIAPRAFLLLGSDKYDNDKSWHYINAARPVYSLLGKPESIGFLNYRAGHRPTPEAVAQAFTWLDHFLGQAPLK
jgi:hypothetical protein